MNTAHAYALEENPQQGQWPRGLSAEPTMAIGQVTEALQKEFPTVSVSKIRFLEDQGLICPSRTSAGYRKFSESDRERLRYILRRQRDSYSPLNAIRDELRALDAGHDVDLAPSARIVASDGEVVVPANQSTIYTRDLADLTGATVETLERYTALGLIAPDIAGYFPSRTVHVVHLLVALEAEGMNARILRSVRTGAERSADVIDQVVSSQLSRQRATDRERAHARSMEFGEKLADLHRELLRISLSRLNGDSPSS